MRFLTLIETLNLHEAVIKSSGGTMGIRDIGALDSAIAQPRMTFNETELYPDIASKATALCFSIVMNHPFVDGNKRVGHAAMAIFLELNGFKIVADVDEQEELMINLAAGKATRQQLKDWVDEHITNKVRL
ncbi:type II toxin-antitoxin system death-on-curing family toxin [Desulfobacter vibrioformis]|uniref:type II toxin-antitoxin system death-on-curing family toxin n=1 Tax=Desulfobacter vibrioformis TaxID=34031 RepID=UPI000A04585E|nr:type II toxin-antitoxin system death-on-curing family toxin [Desulfobacter vibrioformis]